MMDFPVYRQKMMECGPACLYMISKYYGREYSIARLKRFARTTKKGSSMLGLSQAAEQIGFRAEGMQLSYDQLAGSNYLPCIAHWNARHFVVVYRIEGETIYLSDPAYGLQTCSKDIFLTNWTGGTGRRGVILALEPKEPAAEAKHVEPINTAP